MKINKIFLLIFLSALFTACPEGEGMLNFENNSDIPVAVCAAFIYPSTTLPAKENVSRIIILEPKKGGILFGFDLNDKYLDQWDNNKLTVPVVH